MFIREEMNSFVGYQLLGCARKYRITSSYEHNKRASISWTRTFTRISRYWVILELLGQMGKKVMRLIAQ